MANLNNVLASIPGYGGFAARNDQLAGEEQAQLGQVGKLMQLQQMVQERQAGQQQVQRNEAMRAEIEALPPEKRTRENVMPIILKHARNAPEIMQALPASAEKAQPIGSGGLRLPTGEIVPPAARPDTAQKPAPTRQRYDGANVIQEELTPEGWKQIGQGPRFAPEKPEKPRTAPPGFEWTDATQTTLRPIAGGPKDTAPKDLARARGAVQKADTVIGKVDEALGQVGPSTTGTIGAVLGTIPGTPAYDLDKTIDTIKAQLGFSELQAMREASPTGGALGQVAIQELAMLQSTVASMERGQRGAQLKRNLEQVKRHFENWKRATLEATPGLQGDATPPGGTPAPAAPAAAPSGSGWSVREKK